MRKRKVADGTYEIVFESKNRNIKFEAGQYVHVAVPHLEGHDPKGNGRDFSISSSPKNEKSLSITLRRSDSVFKKTILQASHGMKVLINGPYGVFTLPKNMDTPLIFIAGGIGITPFMSMLRLIGDEKLNYKILLLYINKSEKVTAYLDELRTLEKENPNFMFITKTGRFTRSGLEKYITPKTHPNVFIAGAPEMVVTFKKMVLDFGIPEESILIEEFSGYKGVFDNIENDKMGFMKVGRKKLLEIPIASRIVRKVVADYKEEDNPILPSVLHLGSGMEGELGNRSLSDLEALLQALSTTALVSETDAKGNITYANDKFVEISKYSKEELIGQNHRILKSGQHSRAFYENMWAKITRGKLWRGQIKNRAKDGSYYWVDTSIAPILGDDKKPIKYISVRFPITERQQAEEELQEKAKQQNVLTTLSQEALASHDLISLFNTAVKLLSETLNTDYAIVEKLLPDRKSFIFESGAGWADTEKQMSISAKAGDSMAGFTLASKEPVILEDLATESRFSGSSFLHDHDVVSGLTVLIPGQEIPFGVLGVFTKVKRIFTRDDINFIQAVSNLLANAARNQLDKRKDEFLGIASHELKTPLTSIKTFIQLLQKEEEKHSHGRSLLFLSRVDYQLDRVMSLINELLDISRINSGRIEYTDELFEVSGLVKKTAEEIQLVDKKHKIEIHNSVKGKVFGDKYRIQQVVINLLNNAIKYSSEDKIVVRTESGRDKIVVSVQDFGIGVPESEKHHIFERFFQSNGQKKEKFPGGLGLGLYISSEIVKRHKGQIWVESKEGKGSTFYFALPKKH